MINRSSFPYYIISMSWSRKTQMGLLKIVLSIVSYNIIFHYDSHEIIPFLYLIFLYSMFLGNIIDLKIIIIYSKNFHV
jgi:hypothetical protein